MSGSLHHRLAKLEAARRTPPCLPIILVTAPGQPEAEALAEQPEIAASWRDGDPRLPRMVIA